MKSGLTRLPLVTHAVERQERRQELDVKRLARLNGLLPRAAELPDFLKRRDLLAGAATTATEHLPGSDDPEASARGNGAQALGKIPTRPIASFLPTWLARPPIAADDRPRMRPALDGEADPQHADAARDRA